MKVLMETSRRVDCRLSPPVSEVTLSAVWLPCCIFSTLTPSFNTNYNLHLVDTVDSYVQKQCTHCPCGCNVLIPADTMLSPLRIQCTYHCIQPCGFSVLMLVQTRQVYLCIQYTYIYLGMQCTHHCGYSVLILANMSALRMLLCRAQQLKVAIPRWLR